MMAKSSQRAIFVKEVGKPMVKGEREVLQPPKGYIRIRVTATMLLPHDTYGRDFGLFIGERLPYVLGTNIAGVIDELGEGVNGHQIGDEVFGQGDPVYPTPDAAGLQEYAILDAEAAAKIPAGLTADQMVTFPVNATTAANALFHSNYFHFPAPLNGVSDKPEDFDAGAQSIVIIGGGSNVGKLAIQFARILGLGRIVAVASALNEAHLRALGSTHVIDRHATPESIQQQVLAIIPEGVTHVLDCVSWEFSLPISIVSRTKPSKILTLHPAETGAQLAQESGLSTCDVRFVLGHFAQLRPLLKPFWTDFPTWVADRKVNIPAFRVIDGLDLELVEKALDGYRDGSPVTPVIVHPQSKI